MRIVIIGMIKLHFGHCVERWGMDQEGHHRCGAGRKTGIKMLLREPVAFPFHVLHP